MIYIGIDPEPSGAYCIWNDYNDNPNKINLYGTPKDSGERAKTFIDQITVETNHYQLPINFYIEKMWIHPGKSTQSMSKLMTSYGIWIGICKSLAHTHSLPKNVIKIIPAMTWKSYFSLVGKSEKGVTNKLKSYQLAKQIMDNNGLHSGSLGLSNSPTDKQIYDRSEAFLITMYGKKNFT